MVWLIAASLVDDGVRHPGVVALFKLGAKGKHPQNLSRDMWGLTFSLRFVCSQPADFLGGGFRARQGWRWLFDSESANHFAT